MGDGYTIAEKQKHLEHMKRLGKNSKRKVVNFLFFNKNLICLEKLHSKNIYQVLYFSLFLHNINFVFFIVFNTWAVYRPSVESGIGVGGRAKNTAYRLYRQGTQ